MISSNFAELLWNASDTYIYWYIHLPIDIFRSFRTPRKHESPLIIFFVLDDFFFFFLFATHSKIVEKLKDALGITGCLTIVAWKSSRISGDCREATGDRDEDSASVMDFKLRV